MRAVFLCLLCTFKTRIFINNVYRWHQLNEDQKSQIRPCMCNFRDCLMMPDRCIVKVINKTHWAWNMSLNNKFLISFPTMHCVVCLLCFSAVIFGEDVAFGGVFRCTVGLRDKYGNLIFFCVYIHSKKLGIVSFFPHLVYVVRSLDGSRGLLIIQPKPPFRVVFTQRTSGCLSFFPFKLL